MARYEIAFWATNREATYRSDVINTSELPERARIIFRHNKFKKKDNNKPSYIGSFVPVDEESGKEILLKNIAPLRSIIQEANEKTAIVTNSEDSRTTADLYWKRIVEEIENLTGEKIDIRIW